MSSESAVIENASFLFRALYLPYEVPHWLYMPKFTWLRAVSRRQRGVYTKINVKRRLAVSTANLQACYDGIGLIVFKTF